MTTTDKGRQAMDPTHAEPNLFGERSSGRCCDGKNRPRLDWVGLVTAAPVDIKITAFTLYAQLLFIDNA
ncbi:unnamed protein product [Macrosiphum euphorbiae]|uniref:Uncharacterized protein n=1 Tax=Macrosiphum euphorbiae TaxID=13131 RepID=A0AAV0X9W9_9HEMI|nr:unnamed protein product [Macrosiphum euphorbiae]